MCVAEGGDFYQVSSLSGPGLGGRLAWTPAAPGGWRRRRWGLFRFLSRRLFCPWPAGMGQIQAFERRGGFGLPKSSLLACGGTCPSQPPLGSSSQTGGRAAGVLTSAIVRFLSPSNSPVFLFDYKKHVSHKKNVAAQTHAPHFFST